MAEIIGINEKTWRIEDGGVRFLLFCGNEKAALVDTGMNAPDARKIAEGLTDLPLILLGLLTGGQFGDINDILTIVLFLASRTYFVIYFVKEAVLRGERPMAHDRLSGTVYMAVEIPQEDRAEKNKSKKKTVQEDR